MEPGRISAIFRYPVKSMAGELLELMNLKHGIFDEASLSVISLGTVHSVARESGRGVDSCDLRRFRPNVVIETNSAEPLDRSARSVFCNLID